MALHATTVKIRLLARVRRALEAPFARAMPTTVLAHRVPMVVCVTTASTRTRACVPWAFSGRTARRIRMSASHRRVPLVRPVSTELVATHALVRLVLLAPLVTFPSTSARACLVRTAPRA